MVLLSLNVVTSFHEEHKYRVKFVRFFFLHLEQGQFNSVQFSSVVQLCPTLWIPWITARQASLSITNSWNPPKPMFIRSMMPSNHLILCRPLLLLPSICYHQSLFKWVSSSCQVAKVLEFQLQHQSFQWTPGLISLGWTGWISLQSKGLSRVFSNTTVQKHQFFGAQLSL